MKWKNFPDEIPPYDGKFITVVQYKGDTWTEVTLWGRVAICDSLGHSGVYYKKCWFLGQRVWGTKIIKWMEIEDYD